MTANNKAFLLCAGLMLCLCLPSLAQDLVAKIDTGSIDGARYKILFPQNWKGKLVLYAHGYEFTGTPSNNDNPAFIRNMEHYLKRGFAVAASAYRHQGWALPTGVEDTENLRKYFFRTYGRPDTAFIAGTSMGGGIALATIETFPRYYQGALPQCPFASRPYLVIRKEFDLVASFNVVFPGLLPSLKDIFEPKPGTAPVSMSQMFSKIGAIQNQLKKDSVLAVQFARRFDLRFQDLHFAAVFGVMVLRDLALKAEGNPFDNTNTLYTGFPDDWTLNQKVERLPATPETEKFLDRSDRTGELSKPVVLLHTVYDNLIPATFAVTNYDNLVHQKGTEKFLVVKYTNGQGHCQFSSEQIGAAFDALRAWAATGKRPSPGMVE